VSNIQEVKARKGIVVAVVTEGDPEDGELAVEDADDELAVEDDDELFTEDADDEVVGAEFQ